MENVDWLMALENNNGLLMSVSAEESAEEENEGDYDPTLQSLLEKMMDN